VAPGEKGPRVYDWARQRVVESQKGLPGRTVWLLARRAVGQPSELAYYLCHAPRGTALVTLAQVAAARWGIEQGFQEAKGQTGLDQYQVRFWHSWYRHITLSLLAHAWLAAVRSRQGGKRGRWTRSWPS
jgi:SRSO17 transposase